MFLISFYAESKIRFMDLIQLSVYQFSFLVKLIRQYRKFRFWVVFHENSKFSLELKITVLIESF